VVTVVHFAPPFGGGIASAVRALAAIPGVEHRLAGPEDPVALDPSGGPGRWVVHCHHALRWPEAVALARRLGAPAVKTVHILQARQSRLRGLTVATRSEAAQARAIAEADRLTIATGAARAALLEDHPGLDLARVTVLPLPTATPSARAPSQTPTVLAVTRYDAIKGTDLLIEVVARVLAADARTRVVVAGGLPDNPRAQAKWHEAFLAAAPVEARARLELTGWLGPDALAGRYAAAHVFVTTSRLETFGLALREAVEAGVPAIASDLPVHREVAGDAADYVAHGEGAAEAFAAAIRARLEAPAGAIGAAPPRLGHSAHEWLSFWREVR
jgi:glycosyltransferase involved in cell wall biosynthesis